MFCDHCGSSLAPGTNVCPSCGRAILPTNTLTSVSSRLERHLRPLGILWIVASCFFLFPAMIMMILGTVVHFSIPGTEQLARLLGPFVLFLVGAILFFVSFCGIFLGYGLMRRQSWARIPAIVLGVISLFHPPFGTALGIYTLWVLLSDDGKQYQRLATSSP
ncbi:MAG TPA: hypothetical protein VHR84_19060 [Terriglobales bacterium]|nr:hypothetical protein [Terriglobales bacterium]